MQQIATHILIKELKRRISDWQSDGEAYRYDPDLEDIWLQGGDYCLPSLLHNIEEADKAFHQALEDRAVMTAQEIVDGLRRI